MAQQKKNQKSEQRKKQMEPTWKAKRQKREQDQKLVEVKEDQELNEIIMETYRKYRKEPRPKRRFDLEKLTPEGQKF